MVVIDELYNTVVFQISLVELERALNEIKKKKENEIQLLKSKINKFEMQRRKEEAYYQSLSPFRKIFTGRPPSHHQAVEFLVNVKDRFNKIEVIKQKLVLLDSIITKVQTTSEQAEIILPHVVIEEIRNWKETEGNVE